METNNVELKTVLSKRGIAHLEYLLHWVWDSFSFNELTDELMELLEVYAKINPGKPYRETWIKVKTISNIIQLMEQLNEVVEFEDVQSWEDGRSGYVKPGMEKNN